MLGKANIKGNLGGTLEHPMLFGNAKVAGEINPTVNIGYIDKFELNPFGEVSPILTHFFEFLKVNFDWFKVIYFW